MNRSVAFMASRAVELSLKKLKSPLFRRVFALVLLLEFSTVSAAWLLLDSNISSWIEGKTDAVIRLSIEAAQSTDWSRVDSVPKERGSALFDAYEKRLKSLSEKDFPHNEGDVFIVVVKHAQAFYIDPGDPHPMDDFGKANVFEATAYATGKTVHSDGPFSDDSGTTIEALTPIVRSGNVIGLVGAEYDSATLSDFKELVAKAFWLSLLPATLIAVGLALLLTMLFVEPMEIFRQIEKTVVATKEREASREAQKDDPLDSLSPRQRDVADCVRRGLETKEVAEALCISPETVKQHLKDIKAKTGLGRFQLAVHAEVRRVLAAERDAPLTLSGDPPTGGLSVKSPG